MPAECRPFSEKDRQNAEFIHDKSFTVTADPRAGVSRPRFRVVTVSSNKGGVGKTTFACNLAIYLRAMREDVPVLLLTFDDQPMPSRMFVIDDEKPSDTIVTGFRQGNLESAIRLGQYGVHYVPTSTQVAALKSEITSQSDLWQVLVRTDWNGLVIIDTKSDLEILTQNAIAASDLSIVLVSDHASLVESKKVFDLFDGWGRPHERARLLLSLVDLRIKFREGEDHDILAVLLGQIRRLGYPLFESFVSRSPSIEALYTNPDERAYSILQRAPKSLIHKQMHHLADDVLTALLNEGAEWADVVDTEVSQPVVVSVQRPVAPAWVAEASVDRRRQVRLSYIKEVAAFCSSDPAILPLQTRDLSSEGLGIEPVRGLEAGERVQIGLQQRKGDPPLLVWARVVVDDAATAHGLAFESAPPQTSSRLERMIEQLGAEAPHGGAASTLRDDIDETERETVYADAIVIPDFIEEASSDIVNRETIAVADAEGEAESGIVYAETIAMAEAEGEAESGIVYAEAIVVSEELLQPASVLPNEAAALPTSAAEITPVDERPARELTDDHLLNIDEMLAAEALDTDNHPLVEEHLIRPELAPRRLEAVLPGAAVETALLVPIARPVPVTRKPAAGWRAVLQRRSVLAASILLPLSLLAAWQIDEQLSQTRAEPAAETPMLVATVSDTDGAIGQGSDFEQWRQQTADTLLDSLDEDDSSAYLDAIRWLSELEPDETLNVLLERLEAAGPSEEPGAASRRRALAAEALGMLSDPRAEQALRKALAFDDQQVRLAAAKGLQQIRLRENADDLAVAEMP